MILCYTALYLTASGDIQSWKAEFLSTGWKNPTEIGTAVNERGHQGFFSAHKCISNTSTTNCIAYDPYCHVIYSANIIYIARQLQMVHKSSLEAQNATAKTSSACVYATVPADEHGHRRWVRNPHHALWDRGGFEALNFDGTRKPTTLLEHCWCVGCSHRVGFTQKDLK